LHKILQCLVGLVSIFSCHRRKRSRIVIIVVAVTVIIAIVVVVAIVVVAIVVVAIVVVVVVAVSARNSSLICRGICIIAVCRGRIDDFHAVREIT
jgi:hypothetical protein